MAKAYEENGIIKYRGVNYETPMDEFEFSAKPAGNGDTCHYLITDAGTFTVLERQETGHYPYTGDVETGYRDNDGFFWLASGGVDVRTGCRTFGDAVKMVEQLANVVAGKRMR
jgi:hypothetical protein